MIFLDFLKVKMYENMPQNAPDCTIHFGEPCPRTPYQTHSYATRRKSPPPPKKINSWPPLANPAYAHA